MKFQMLALGARFEFEGKEYVKTGPLTAATEGGQRMIPRFAVLKPLDPPVAQSRKPQRKLDSAMVLAAFETFYGEAVRLLDVDALPMEARRDQLETARAGFMARLSSVESAGEIEQSQ